MADCENKARKKSKKKIECNIATSSFNWKPDSMRILRTFLKIHDGLLSKLPSTNFSIVMVINFDFRTNIFGICCVR